MAPRSLLLCRVIRSSSSGCFSTEEVTKLSEQRKLEVRGPRNLLCDSLMRAKCGQYCGHLAPRSRRRADRLWFFRTRTDRLQYRCPFGTSITSFASLELINSQITIFTMISDTTKKSPFRLKYSHVLQIYGKLPKNEHLSSWDFMQIFPSKPLRKKTKRKGWTKRNCGK